MVKTIKYTGFVLVLIGVSFFAFKLMRKPDTDVIIEKTKFQKQSQVSYPENYKMLVKKDQQNNKTFLINDAVSCVLVENKFPYNRKDFNIHQTTKILQILNDSSSYC